MHSMISERMVSSVVMTIEGDASTTIAGETTWAWLQARPILGLAVPACNAGNVTFQISLDGGTTPLALLDADGSTPAVEIAVAGTGFCVSSDDLSPLAGYCGRVAGAEVLVRAAFDAAQTGDRTLTWLLVA